jgi:hypothetical protein
MTTFLLDLWQDLRAKRLWPVAVALLAATAAVPFVLFKPASSAPAPQTASTASKQGKLPAVTLDASSIGDSHLDVFKSKNPFASEGDRAAAAAGTNPLGDSLGSAVEKAGGSTDGSAGGDAGSVPGGDGGGSTTPGGDTSGPAPKGPDGKPMEPGVHYFTYTADVLFGARGHTKTYKGVQELDLLPDGDSPVVAFMGVRSAKTAMFFIADPAFRADGEGECSPSPDNCMFVYLSTDEGHNEETLSAQNGRIEYVLKLEDLHTKGLSEDQALGDTTPDKSGDTAKRSKRQRRSLLSLPQARMIVR